MPTTPIADGVAAMRFAANMTLGLFDDIPDDKLWYQPFEHANHAAWNMGHLAVSNDGLLSLVSGNSRSTPALWDRFYAMKTEPVGADDQTPNAIELRDAFAKSVDDVAEWYQSLSPADLEIPVPDRLKDFAPSRLSLLFSITWHIGVHTGELTVIRKSLGKKPLYV